MVTCLRSVIFPTAKMGAGGFSPLPLTSVAAQAAEPALLPAGPSPALANGLSQSRWVSGTGKQRDCGGREAPLHHMVPISSPVKSMFTAGITAPLREAFPKATRGVGDPGPFLLHPGRTRSIAGGTARRGQGLNASERLSNLSPGTWWAKPVAAGTDVPRIVWRISAAYADGAAAEPPAPWPARPMVSLSRTAWEEVERGWKNASPEPGNHPAQCPAGPAFCGLGASRPIPPMKESVQSWHQMGRRQNWARHRQGRGHSVASAASASRERKETARRSLRGVMEEAWWSWLQLQPWETLIQLQILCGFEPTA